MNHWHSPLDMSALCEFDKVKGFVYISAGLIDVLCRCCGLSHVSNIFSINHIVVIQDLVSKSNQRVWKIFPEFPAFSGK